MLWRSDRSQRHGTLEDRNEHSIFPFWINRLMFLSRTVRVMIDPFNVTLRSRQWLLLFQATQALIRVSRGSSMIWGGHSDVTGCDTLKTQRVVAKISLRQDDWECEAWNWMYKRKPGGIELCILACKVYEFHFGVQWFIRPQYTTQWLSSMICIEGDVQYLYAPTYQGQH